MFPRRFPEYPFPVYERPPTHTLGFMHDFRGGKVDVRKRQNYPRNPTNFKNSFQGYLIRGNIKKSAKYDFIFSKNLLRNSSLILGEKKRGKDFRLFFSIYLRSRTVLGNLTEKKSIFFSTDLSAKL